MRDLVAVTALLASCVARASASELKPRYDVVVVGGGVKESLLAGLLASHGKEVLHLEGVNTAESNRLDLQQLAELTEGPDAKLAEQRVGKPTEYSIERAPKMFMASGRQLQLFVSSGAWQHMNPPGFKRVQRSLIYRRRADGQPDVHRILSNSEDVVKTRMLAPLEKARVVQFFLWVEKYEEGDVRTHVTGPLSKRTLDLRKMSAAKFLAYWELPKEAASMVVRGMALHAGTNKALKKMPAIELVRKLKRYKDAHRTFPHMTSPYVYPVGGFGSALSQATAHTVEANGGDFVADAAVDEILFDDAGKACGVATGGERVLADCVVMSPDNAPDRVESRGQIVRMYAVLSHPPNMCKDANSCQLLVPAAACGRAHDIYLSSYSSTHGVAPKGKWLVVASTWVEGDVEGADALAVAKQEMSAVMPILKPTRKLLAEVVDVYAPKEAAQADGLVVLPSEDETSCKLRFPCCPASSPPLVQQMTLGRHPPRSALAPCACNGLTVPRDCCPCSSTDFDSVESDVAAAFEEVAGESLASLR